VHFVSSVAGLLEKLAPCGVLETLVALDAPAGQKPCTGERTRGLFHKKNATGLVDTGHDGTDAGPCGHAC
jgi:hypothetical protein